METEFQDSVGEACAGLRLDVYLAGEIEDASRSFLKKLVKDGQVSLNGAVCTKPSRTLALDDEVHVIIPPPPPAIPEAEDIPLDILYEDAQFLIVNKVTGMVVHPAPGHHTGTLVNAVLHHCPDFQRSGADLTRPGIVHRLDRDTSGVMVVAKTQAAFLDLSRQAAEHTFDRRYLALVRGEFSEDRGKIDATIGRSLTQHGRMAVTGIRGKEAVTHFEVLERFPGATLLGLRLDTGRTHQIRVHLRFAGRPVLGDPVYGVTDYRTWGPPEPVDRALARLTGQALHAEQLGLCHPATKERVQFAAPPPPDFQAVLGALRQAG